MLQLFLSLGLLILFVGCDDSQPAQTTSQVSSSVEISEEDAAPIKPVEDTVSITPDSLTASPQIAEEHDALSPASQDTFTREELADQSLQNPQTKAAYIEGKKALEKEKATYVHKRDSSVAVYTHKKDSTIVHHSDAVDSTFAVHTQVKDSTAKSMKAAKTSGQTAIDEEYSKSTSALQKEKSKTSHTLETSQQRLEKSKGKLGGDMDAAFDELDGL